MTLSLAWAVTLLVTTACERPPASHPAQAAVVVSPEYDPPSSELRFRRLLQERGVPVEHMTPAMGVAAMLDFYAQTRFAVAPGGDTLRIAWHADRRKTPRVRFTLARDFVWPSNTAKDGVERWSLWMTFQPAGIDLGPDTSDGVHRCVGTDTPATCAAFLRALPIYQRIADRIDDTAEIGFDPTPR